MSSNELTSHQEYRERYFDTGEVNKYAQRLFNSKTHVREIKCISKALADTARGAHLLDIPCGAGRLLPDLVALGYRVTAADVAPLMLEEARKYVQSRQLIADVDYAVADVLDTGFKDNSFDVVICNRMFHHFREPEVRVAGLKELKRIARQYLVVSFFCNFSSDAFFFHIGNFLREEQIHRSTADLFWSDEERCHHCRLGGGGNLSDAAGDISTVVPEAQKSQLLATNS